MPRGSRTSDPLPRGLAIEETIGGSGAHGRPTTGFSSFGGDSPRAASATARSAEDE